MVRISSCVKLEIGKLRFLRLPTVAVKLTGILVICLMVSETHGVSNLFSSTEGPN
jgi:hypothetical protein